MGSGITVLGASRGAHDRQQFHRGRPVRAGPHGLAAGAGADQIVRHDDRGELDRHVFGDGGLFAYLGTRDLMEVERRIDAGDHEAAAVFEAMIYQIGKEAGAMAAVLEGKVDAVLVTGGMAHSHRVVARLRRSVEWIAPVAVYPGEDELRALADGVFRVLDGEESARRMGQNSDLGAEGLVL